MGLHDGQGGRAARQPTGVGLRDMCHLAAQSSVRCPASPKRDPVPLPRPPKARPTAPSCHQPLPHPAAASPVTP